MPQYAPDYATPDYELAWPRDVFVSEGQALLAYSGLGWTERARLLLDEAFEGQVPIDELMAASWHDLPGAMGAWASGSTTGGEDAQRRALAILIRDSGQMQERRSPRPYFAARRGQDLVTPAGPPGPAGPDLLRRTWPVIIDRLVSTGYLSKVAPKPCVDDTDPPPPVDQALEAEIRTRTGVPGLWPMRPNDWDDDLLLTMIEVVHDLVARPRERTWHRWDECGWHYGRFAIAPAQRLYRAQANLLLTDSGLGLSLADQGEDVGRLVNAPTDSRTELLQQALDTPDPAARRTVEHAVALFRGRGASVEQRRSAAFNLASLLEERRSMLKAELLPKDEGALFQIANQFAIRHRNAAQQENYDPAFLDWIFWLYLATFELSDRLLARQAG